LNFVFSAPLFDAAPSTGIPLPSPQLIAIAQPSINAIDCHYTRRVIA
jgi:hypothetical protein